MAQIAADVFGCFEAFGIEALGIELEATMVVVALGDGAL